MERHPVFGLCAPEAGWVPAPRYALRRARVLSLLERMDRCPLLEIGCGAGALLDDLAELGFRCHALEPSATARTLAAALNRGRPETQIDAAPRASWEGRFGIVLAFEVLEHIEDDAGALEQWRSWLADRGRLLLSVPARMSRWSASDLWAGHFRRYERAGLRSLLESKGFSVEHLECYGFPLTTLTHVISSWVHARDLAREARAGVGGVDLRANTARSGVQRSLETRLFPLQKSTLGILTFKLCCRLQTLTQERELGTGYIVLAQRR